MEKQNKIDENFILILDSNDPIEFDVVFGLLDATDLNFTTDTPGAGYLGFAWDPIYPWKIFVHKNDYDEAVSLINKSKNWISKTYEDIRWQKKLKIKRKRDHFIGRTVSIVFIIIFGALAYLAFDQSKIISNLLSIVTLFFVIIFVFSFSPKNKNID